MISETRKILIIDDNHEFANIIARVLEGQGYQILMAYDGNTALQKIEEAPELVLLDLKLPDLPGEEVLKRIKGVKEDLGVIIITGYGNEQVAVELMKTGALDFLSKPFDNETLIEAVKNAFRIRDLQMEEKENKKFSSLEHFFPFLAHEIRNPLHAIGGALAVITRRVDLKDEILYKSIKIIQEEVEHLNKFVEECLDFVQPSIKSRFIEVDIKGLILAVVNMVSYMFEELLRKIKINVEIDSRLPKIYANYEEIKQVFVNILKNSFEAMSEGEIGIKGSFKGNSNPGWVEILFQDNGPGIKNENLKYLFKPFHTTKLRGTGLGLAICRRIIVERHHGKIAVESEEGKGTTVKVYLPVKPIQNDFMES